MLGDQQHGIDGELIATKSQGLGDGRIDGEIKLFGAMNTQIVVTITLVDVGADDVEVIDAQLDVSPMFRTGADYFGEMALLDGEARSADAKTVDESILLKLDENDFEKIMYSNDKIVKGILSMLSQRLRRANELLNQKK